MSDLGRGLAGRQRQMGVDDERTSASGRRRARGPGGPDRRPAGERSRDRPRRRAQARARPTSTSSAWWTNTPGTPSWRVHPAPRARRTTFRIGPRRQRSVRVLTSASASGPVKAASATTTADAAARSTAVCCGAGFLAMCTTICMAEGTSVPSTPLRTSSRARFKQPRPENRDASGRHGQPVAALDDGLHRAGAERGAQPGDGHLDRVLGAGRAARQLARSARRETTFPGLTTSACRTAAGAGESRISMPSSRTSSPWSSSS